MDDFVSVSDIAFVADHGTIVTFEGTTPDGDHVTFGVDHRPARDLLAALADPTDPIATAAVPSWAITRRVPAAAS